jgi:hypothetical protein
MADAGPPNIPKVDEKAKNVQELKVVEALHRNEVVVAANHRQRSPAHQFY